ncbi:MAG: repair protein RadA [Acidimicrobiales bacterium]|nr:repair protein RadA [Acidimicrobiales bacterium]
MSRLKTVYRCTECGGSSPKWLGRCPACEAWNTLVEEAAAERTPMPLAPTSQPVLMADVDLGEYAHRPTGIGELDRVLGGGLVPGSVTLVGGEPGIGKSTLLLQVLAALARGGARCLLVTAEESVQQVRTRADRLTAVAPEFFLVAETSLAHVLAHVDELAPDVLVVDSVQTIYDADLGSAPGSVAQVRECAARLVREAKERGMTTVLVGHVTKDGALAGPRVLEHVVDTVLSFEGDRHHALRLLRAVKHRFGSTSELGLFEMTEKGMIGVPDPSGLFLADRRNGVAGSIVLPAMEGHRPLLVEVQALVSPSQLPQPRRSAQGLDSGRLALILAVLAQRAGVGLGTFDVHASAVGGVKVVEPGADLAVALALVSSVSGQPLADDLVACGEIGLAGELRQVSQTARRLAEAARLGFRTAIIPASAPEPPGDIRALRAATVADAIRLAGIVPG